MSSPAPSRWADEQARRNRARDGHWRESADHRARVTDRILSLASKSPGSLCLQGAGNLNDLDLPRLLAGFAEVHLVDLDGEALERGVARQVPDAERANLTLHGGIELTGICEDLESVTNRPPSDWELLATRALDPVPASLQERAGVSGPFDVVASVGVLSQLIDMVVQTVPAADPHFLPLLVNVRTGHLRLLARLTAPGGRGLLVTDFVSSETVPELTRLDAAELPALAERLANARNFFHGLNPLALPAHFDNDPVLHELVAGIRHQGYWLWNQQSRLYAVLAIELSRR